MVRLEQLCERLGNELRPATRGAIGRQRLTGVHISELADPTPYLEGGELLLTTGIPLRGGPGAIGDYVRRLANKGVALALGLGEGTDQVDPQLVSACADAAVELYLVPDGVPFQNISRAFWQLVGESEQAELASRLGLQTALARAATRENAALAIVSVLAQGLGGWATYLLADGTAEAIWPPSAVEHVPQLRAESARFELVGAYSAATFPMNGMDVVEHSIPIGQRTVGFLAVGAGRGVRKADRQLILTACTLLSLTAQRAEESLRADIALGETIAALIFAGHVDAARLVTEEAGRFPLGIYARLLAVRGRASTFPDARDLARLIASLGYPDSTLVATVGGIRLVILPERAGGSADAPSTCGAEYAVAVGDPRPLEELAAAMGQVAYTCRTAAFGTVAGVDGVVDARDAAWVDALARHPRGDLRDTVRSYLTHRGHWESAARELGIHRNSVRHRIAVAAELIGADLADPDTSAALWIALRRHQELS